MKKEYIPAIALTIVFFTALAPWAYYQSDRFMQADAIFLTYAAEQLLAGKAMTESYFDNNPPMSYIIFIPSVVIKSLGLELWHAHLVYILTLIGISAGFSAFFLSRIQGLSSGFRLFFICTLLYALTVPMSFEFGQKDHLIAIALFPFTLAQYLLLGTDREKNTHLTTIIVTLALIVFTPFILLKPHYGLIPSALILYRWHYTRSFATIFKIDFFVLAAGVIIYAIVIFTFFQDFMSTVIEASLQLYIKNQSNLHDPGISIAALFFSGCMAVLTFLTKNETSPAGKHVIMLFWLATALSIVPFYLQNKGWSIHFLPFFCLAITCSACTLYLRSNQHKKRQHMMALACAILFVAITSVIAKPLNTYTHDYFKNHPLMAELGIDGDATSFFIENNTTNIVYPIAMYNNIRLASRFPSNWLISDALLELNQEELQNMHDLLGNMIAEDINHHKPETMLFLNDTTFAGYLTLLKNHPALLETLNDYEDPETFETDILYFYESSQKEKFGAQTYNLYRRKKSAP